MIRMILMPSAYLQKTKLKTWEKYWGCPGGFPNQLHLPLQDSMSLRVKRLVRTHLPKMILLGSIYKLALFINGAAPVSSLKMEQPFINGAAPFSSIFSCSVYKWSCSIFKQLCQTYNKWIGNSFKIIVF